MKRTELSKGQHEEQVENVKDMLERGMGIIEVIDLTSLSEEEVIGINDELRCE